MSESAGAPESIQAPFIQTPEQTIGPFYGYSLPYQGGSQLVDRSAPGALRLHGMVFDGAGQGIPDAMVEIWQADDKGAIPREPGSIGRDGYTFTGFGRTPTDAVGNYQFTTVEPAGVDGGLPFFAAVVFARGLMHKLHTRIYVPEAADNGTDSLLSAVAPERRSSLIAVREADGSLRHDIHLQGEKETVFLAY
ncbi:MAG: protocatechuate 3,4-dioxygenase subunit alpha [Terrimesophilobacter sp.]